MTKYSKTAIALHWVIAILVVTNVTLASMSEDLPRAAKAAYMNPHKAIGVSILMLSLFRLFWRLGHKPPAMLFDITLPFGKNESVAGVGHEAHEILTKPLVILIFLHVIAALKHQFADRVPFIQRMWP
jgi:cytochrome b561